ncbi:DUF3142 domain-containing protein [Serratia rhizosphaerae]|uniref:DUF3142 domain-containing protein n=1 Tax=Serratia rhizosphaerae TaxID=2597702 RepID=UPI002DBE71FF|nr:DUF3142 domain-containing protein [Serratia rhizosphaerae]MEB6334512.1 DUF3142 domain-containing protein [Serratia rhizosphaerae]
MKRWAAALLLVLLAFGAWLAGRHQALSVPPVWDQQVYLWQRVWSAQHAPALAASRDLFSSLRILALQLHPREGLRVMPVDTALLKQDGRPLWLVARLDGSQPRWDEERLYSRLLQLVQQYRAAGLPVVGIEIDHDAATARLPQYHDALRRLRRQLPADVQLSITALPAWLDSPQLPALLRQVDSSVLQLHAVLSPQQGLFDSRLALRWTQRYAQVTDKPFRIALPAYGMGLVGVDAQGAQVESEASLRVAGSLRELTVAPQHIADFLQRLSAHPQPHLQGVVWFRLPLAGDRRAWSMNTLRRVIRQQPLHSRWQVKMRPQPQQNGLYDLIIANDGPADAPLPAAVTLAAGDCLAADAVGRYRLDATATQLRFIRTGDELVRAGQSRPLGWLRCQHLTPGGIRVTP